MPNLDPPDTGFAHSHALVVGIDDYTALPPLKAAVADARAIATALVEQGYTVGLHVDPEATTRAALRAAFDALPARLGPADRLLIYFAGHGVAEDGEDEPKGYLAPSDATHDDLGTLIPMSDLYDLVCGRVTCRHRLLVLDCCFAGSFSWSATRMGRRRGDGRGISRHRHRRYVEHPAVQVLTSAAADQKALDVVDGMTIGRRPVTGDHSPFAIALLDGLTGEAGRSADRGPDRVVTATELYLHIRDAVEGRTDARQTPGLWPLKGHGRGEYVFWPTGAPDEAELPEDPRLDDRANPWLGLAAYSADQGDLFFGRDAEIDALCARLDDPEAPWLIAVVAASGAGKSSVVRAGLLPRIAAERTLIGPLRPGPAPEQALAEALAALDTATRPVVIIDQFEEIFTLACPEDERDRVFGMLAALSARPDLRLVLTLRADFEGYVGTTALGPALRAGRFVLGPMTRDGLRDVILRPAERRVLFFEPPGLVDALVDEVVALPGGLPLLSFTLAEMYRAYVESDAADRTLTRAHYDALGGVVGALRTRASALYDAADPAERQTIRRLMLRLVSGDAERARRRATAAELLYDDQAEQRRMDAVVERFVARRLLVRGAADGPDGRTERYVEPAHDVLVRGWDRIYAWIAEAREVLPLQQALWRAARGWRDAGEPPGRLWDGDPRLPQTRTPAALADLNALERRFVEVSAARRRRRRLTLAGAVLAVMAALAGAAVYALGEAERADGNAAVAERRRLEAESQTRTARARTVQARAATRQAVAERELERDPTTAALVLSEAPIAMGSTAHQLLVDAAHSPWLAVAVLRGHDGPVVDVDVSPDGSRILTASRDGTARVWPADGLGTPIVLSGHEGPIDSAEFSPDGHRVLTASRDGTARIRPADGRGAPVVLVGHGGAVNQATFSADGSQVLTASEDNTTRIWSATGEGEPVVLTGHEGGVFRLAASPDGAVVVTSSWDATARVWPAGGGASTLLPAQSVLAMRFSPDGRWLALGGLAGVAHLVSAGRFTESRRLTGHRDWIVDAHFDPLGERLVTASLDATARVWSVDGAGEPVTLEGHSGRLQTVRFSPDGLRVVTGSADGTARIWRADGHGAPIALSGHAGQVNEAVFSADGGWVVTGSADGTARIWGSTDDHASIRALPGFDPPAEPTHWRTQGDISDEGRWVMVASPEGSVRLTDLEAGGSRDLGTVVMWIRAARFDPDRDRLIAVDGTCTVYVWPLVGARPVRSAWIPTPDPDCWGVEVAPRGEHIAVRSESGDLRLWSLEGDEHPVAAGLRHSIDGVTFSPHGERLAITSFDGVALVAPADGRGPAVALEVEEPQEIHFTSDGAGLLVATADGRVHLWSIDGRIGPVDLPGHGVRGLDLVSSPRGARVAYARLGRTVSVWRLDALGEPAALSGHLDLIVDMAFSPDGTRLVTASSDRTARVWSADGAHPPVILRHDHPVLAARFMADGERVVTVSEHGAIRVWLVDPEALRRHVDQHLRWCLPVDFRVERLGETRDEATAARDACRRRKGLDLLAGP